MTFKWTVCLIASFIVLWGGGVAQSALVTLLHIGRTRKCGAIASKG